MPKRLIQYSLLISCPGDIEEEVGIIEDCVSRFNNSFSDTLGIEVVTKYWGKNSFPQSGGKPQQLINRQIVDACDAAVAIFWTKFGTPTENYGSGTEEEVERMLASHKQVFMYFSDKKVSPSQLNSDEYKKVRAFKEKYKDKGLYFSYSSLEEFDKQFFSHLSQYFLSEKRVHEIKSECCPALKIVGITAVRRIDNNAHIMEFVPNARISKDQYLRLITNLVNDISNIKIEKDSMPAKSSLTSLVSSFYKPVEISDGDRKLISSVADVMELDIPDDFFFLGNLVEEITATNLYGSARVDGTELEKTKYKKLKELKKRIIQFSDWMRIVNAFSQVKCIKLALQNYGTAIDEDVEITLRFPRDCILQLQDFPSFSNDEKGYLLNTCDMKYMFGINDTPEYLNYYASIVKDYIPRQRRTSFALPGQTPNYSSEFSDELRNVFRYDFFNEGNSFVVKLNMQYIKHHTTVAFPTILFIQSTLEQIEYTITSRNIPEVIHGTIDVLAN